MMGGGSNSDTPKDRGASKVLGLDQIPPLTPPSNWGLQAGDMALYGLFAHKGRDTL